MAHKHKLTEEELFCLEGCREYKQYVLMRRRFETEACTFCKVDRELNIVLWEDDFFMAWRVPQTLKRKKGFTHQFLLVPKRHIRYPWEMTEKEALSLLLVQTELAGEYEFEGGMLFARFGDMRLNAGTVPHLHWNLWVPDGTTEIRIPIYKSPADREANRDRAAEFAARYELGETP